MSTQAIETFLRTAYTDEKLAALLAWAEDGGLSAISCCCLIGIVTVKRGAFLRAYQFGGQDLEHVTQNFDEGASHYQRAKLIQGAFDAEVEFIGLGDDEDRRAKIIPLIKQEMQRREALRSVDISPVEINEFSLQTI